MCAKKSFLSEIIEDAESFDQFANDMGLGEMSDIHEEYFDSGKLRDPRDSSQSLEKVLVGEGEAGQTVKINVNPRTGGIFVEDDQFELFQRIPDVTAKLKSALGRLGIDRSGPSGEADAASRQPIDARLICPLTREPMMEISIEGVIIEVSRGGAWFEDGELTSILEQRPGFFARLRGALSDASSISGAALMSQIEWREENITEEQERILNEKVAERKAYLQKLEQELLDGKIEENILNEKAAELKAYQQKLEQELLAAGKRKTELKEAVAKAEYDLRYFLDELNKLADRKKLGGGTLFSKQARPAKKHDDACDEISFSRKVEESLSSYGIEIPEYLKITHLWAVKNRSIDCCPKEMLRRNELRLAEEINYQEECLQLWAEKHPGEEPRSIGMVKAILPFLEIIMRRSWKAYLNSTEFAGVQKHFYDHYIAHEECTHKEVDRFFHEDKIFTLYSVESIMKTGWRLGVVNPEVKESLESYFSSAYVDWIETQKIHRLLGKYRRWLRNPVMHGRKTSVTKDEYQTMLGDMINGQSFASWLEGPNQVKKWFVLRDVGVLQGQLIARAALSS